MSFQYDQYLKQHKDNVAKGFNWIKDNLPELIKNPFDIDIERQICMRHDESKNDPDEYDAYDTYFYGGNRSFAVVSAFRAAWLKHIHRNPHHWQHWVLINDEPGEGIVCIEMPYDYILEMICDWWAFSWNSGNLNEIFEWYEKHKSHMKLHERTRETVESILDKLKEKLEENVKND